MPSRRHILEVLSAAPLLATAGCVAAAPGPDPFAAWRNPGEGETDPRRFVLAHGLLAPNPHNRQAWLIRLEGSDAMSLFIDRTRTLPQTDPFGRQVVLGCGAFLELVAQSAPRIGRIAEIQVWPEGAPEGALDDRPFARVTLRQDAGVAPGPLFAQIARRRTEKAPFVPTPPTDAAVAAVLQAAQAPGVIPGETREAGLRRSLIDVCWEGWGIETGTKRTHMESVNLTRIGKAEVARNPDGIDLSGGMIDVMAGLGMLTREALADPTSSASKTGEDMFRKMIDATPAFFWIRSETADRVAQLASGRAYVRAQLAAGVQGLAMHPWSLALQEYPEMAGPYAKVQSLLGARPDAPVQMLVRLGAVPAPGDPAPRRRLDDLIRV